MPTEREISIALNCEFRVPCCENGHDCDHHGVLPSVKMNRHCEDLVNEDLCPFITAGVNH